MKGPPLPPFRVAERGEPGTNYVAHAIYIQTDDGEQLVHSQIGPYDKGEPEQRIRAFMRPEPVRQVRAYTANYAQATPRPGRPRKDAPPRYNPTEDE